MKKVILFLVFVLLVTAATACSSESKPQPKFSIKNITVNGVKIGDPVNEGFEKKGESDDGVLVKTDGGATFAAMFNAETVDTVTCDFTSDAAPAVTVNGKSVSNVEDVHSALGEPDQSSEDFGGEASILHTLNYYNDDERITLTFTYYENKSDGSKELKSMSIVAYPEGY